MSRTVNHRGGERTACITLDLENNWTFESDEFRYLVFDHINEYVDMIRSLDLPLTVFVVGEVLEDRPDVVRKLDEDLDVEFQLHSHCHDMDGEADIEVEIRDGIRAFRSVLGYEPRGYRAPRFIVDETDLAALDEAGFTFDSSVCPSYRPGVYNNLRAPTEPYFPASAPGLVEFPLSVHPQLRVPFEQSYLRLLRGPYLCLLGRTDIPDPLIFNSHLHDFFHTAAHEELRGLRRFLFTANLDSSIQVFERFVALLRKRGYSFEKLGDVAETVSENRDVPVLATQ